MGAMTAKWRYLTLIFIQVKERKRKNKMKNSDDDFEDYEGVKK